MDFDADLLQYPVRMRLQAIQRGIIEQFIAGYTTTEYRWRLEPRCHNALSSPPPPAPGGGSRGAHGSGVGSGLGGVEEWHRGDFGSAVERFADHFQSGAGSCRGWSQMNQRQ